MLGNHPYYSSCRKVALAQNSKGDFSLRNLRIQKVVNEQEAMKLLLIGDANR